MNRLLCAISACLITASAVPSASAAIVSVGESSAPWLGYMNVFELPSNGGGFVFGSPWGVSDLVANFNDPAHSLTLAPNSVNDANPFWYTPAGGPGSMGNKVMEANLYQETTDVLNGQAVTFQGFVQSNTFTAAHVAQIFIRDFAPDYSSSIDVFVPLTPGAFSLTLNTDPGAGRHVQFGFQVKGPDVWITDVGPFGTAVISTVPGPATGALGVIAGLVAMRRRRA